VRLPKDWLDGLTDHEALAVSIAVKLAGPIAEYIRRRSGGINRLNNDYDAVVKLLGTCGITAADNFPIEKLEIAVEGELRRSWPGVRALAGTLLECRVVGGSRAHRVLAAAPTLPQQLELPL